MMNGQSSIVNTSIMVQLSNTHSGSSTNCIVWGDRGGCGQCRIR